MAVITRYNSCTATVNYFNQNRIKKFMAIVKFKISYAKTISNLISIQNDHVSNDGFETIKTTPAVNWNGLRSVLGGLIANGTNT